jgi:hypothetical protein
MQRVTCSFCVGLHGISLEQNEAAPEVACFLNSQKYKTMYSVYRLRIQVLKNKVLRFFLFLFFFIFFFTVVPSDIIKVFYLPTDAQENCFKKKIYIKTAPTSFGLITIIKERTIRAS